MLTRGNSLSGSINTPAGVNVTESMITEKAFGEICNNEKHHEAHSHPKSKRNSLVKHKKNINQYHDSDDHVLLEINAKKKKLKSSETDKMSKTVKF
jgi:hypothetical protein